MPHLRPMGKDLIAIEFSGLDWLSIRKVNTATPSTWSVSWPNFG